MASLSSRIKSSGFQKGFFGQLNTNIEKEADKQAKMEESVRGMKRNMDLYKSKAVYDTVQADITAKREHSRKFKAAGGYDDAGNFTDAGWRMRAQESNSNWDALTVAQQSWMGRRAKREAGGKTSYTDWSNTLFGTDAGPTSVSDMKASNPANTNVSRGIDSIIEANTVTARDGAFVGQVGPEVSVVAGEGVDNDPYPTGPVKVARTIPNITLEGGEVVSRSFDEFGNVVGPDVQISGIPEEKVDELGPARRVNLLNENNKALRGEFVVRLNKKTNVEEINTGPNGTFVPLGNTKVTPSSKLESKATAAADPRGPVRLTDTEKTQVAYISSARGLLNKLALTAQVKDRSIRAGALRLYNGLSEIMVANGLAPGDTNTLLTLMASHDNDVLAWGLGTDSGISVEEKLNLLEYVKNGPTASEDAAYMKGAINALKKMIPLQIVRASSDNPRPSALQVKAIADTIDGLPIGKELGGAVAEYRDLMNVREGAIWEQKYSQVETPADIKKAGWSHGGEVYRDRNGRLFYTIIHSNGKKTSLPVGTHPSVGALNKKRDEK